MRRSIRHRLLAHASGPPGNAAVSVEIERDDAAMTLRYGGSAAGTFVFPPPCLPGLADDLWRHTCCEAFIASSGEAAYREFNFSPSGQWAVYDFSAYRQPAATALVASPGIDFRRDGEEWRLEATIPAVLLPDGKLELGLAAVLEAVGGSLGYHALHHPAERADFHDRRGFILHLP